MAIATKILSLIRHERIKHRRWETHTSVNAGRKYAGEGTQRQITPVDQCLSEDIIEEILSRLPAKSLLKFKCVSKSWCSLIASERFIKTHLLNSTKNATTSAILINTESQLNSSNTELTQCSWPSILDRPTMDSFAFGDSIESSQGKSVRMMGCCNGLVFIVLDYKAFVLWNPCTRKSKKLPDMSVEIDGSMISCCIGFGYDESTDAYKVFVLLLVLDTTNKIQQLGKVYNSKTNSWTLVIQTGYSVCVSGPGKFAGGSLHWISELNPSIITCFDLKREVFGKIEKPRHSKDSCHNALGVLGGCLSVIYEHGKGVFGVWLMKQYGVQESWVQLTTLNVCNLSDGRVFRPYGWWSPSGEYVLVYGSSFAVRWPRPRLDTDHKVWNSELYIPSLVSLIDSEEAK